jgi:hypothetical protein
VDGDPERFDQSFESAGAGWLASACISARVRTACWTALAAIVHRQLRLDDRSRWHQFCRLGNEVVQALMKGRHAAFITVPTHAVTHDGNLAVVLAVQRRIASQGTEDRVNAIE